MPRANTPEGEERRRKLLGLEARDRIAHGYQVGEKIHGWSDPKGDDAYMKRLHSELGDNDGSEEKPIGNRRNGDSQRSAPKWGVAAGAMERNAERLDARQEEQIKAIDAALQRLLITVKHLERRMAYVEAEVYGAKG